MLGKKSDFTKYDKIMINRNLEVEGFNISLDRETVELPYNFIYKVCDFDMLPMYVLTTSQIMDDGFRLEHNHSSVSSFFDREDKEYPLLPFYLENMFNGLLAAFPNFERTDLIISYLKEIKGLQLTEERINKMFKEINQRSKVSTPLKSKEFSQLSIALNHFGKKTESKYSEHQSSQKQIINSELSLMREELPFQNQIKTSQAKSSQKQSSQKAVGIKVLQRNGQNMLPSLIGEEQSSGSVHRFRIEDSAKLVKTEQQSNSKV